MAFEIKLGSTIGLGLARKMEMVYGWCDLKVTWDPLICSSFPTSVPLFIMFILQRYLPHPHTSFIIYKADQMGIKGWPAPQMQITAYQSLHPSLPLVGSPMKLHKVLYTEYLNISHSLIHFVYVYWAPTKCETLGWEVEDINQINVVLTSMEFIDT